MLLPAVLLEIGAEEICVVFRVVVVWITELFKVDDVEYDVVWSLVVVWLDEIARVEVVRD